MKEEALEISAHPDEILYGRAGLLYSLLFVRKHSKNVVIIDDKHIQELVEVIIQSGVSYSQRNKVKNRPEDEFLRHFILHCFSQDFQ